jgi:hypothetical protein
VAAGVAVLAVGEVALDDRLEAGLEQEALRDAVEGRGEARDGRRGEQAAGAQRAPRLLQGAGAVGRLGEVVQRPEQEDHVGAVVVDRQRARIAEDDRGQRRVGLGGGGGAGLIDVQGHRVHEVHRVALGGQRQRVGAGRAADVEDRDGRRGQEAGQQLAGAQELEPSPVGQAALLLSAVVVGGDLVLVGHARQRSPG